MSFPYRNPNPVPIVELSYDLPHGTDALYGATGYLDFTPNPIITIKYADGNKTVIDTNLIYKRGYDAGVKDKNDSIKQKLGLK